MSAVVSPLHPLEFLADDLVESCRAVSQQACRFLVLLREFDLRRGYQEARGRGRTTTGSAEWLDARCGIGRDAVQEKLRVAYGLLNLPQTESAFEAGEVSFAKVRALVEVATAANESVLLDVARVMTDAQVVDYCERLRRPEEPRAEGETNVA